MNPIILAKACPSSGKDVGDVVLLVDALGDASHHLAGSDFIASSESLFKQGHQRVFPQHWRGYLQQIGGKRTAWSTGAVAKVISFCGRGNAHLRKHAHVSLCEGPVTRPSTTIKPPPQIEPCPVQAELILLAFADLAYRCSHPRHAHLPVLPKKT